ncbi:MAG: glycerophosphodiester phosphodiesterase family protein [Candidatus Latescibacteria bacterium]|jgi:glycerophosphoryl diester phosphodiesterase|nr:glycerophosphodiester phosphodiesterase family protein [Candidatus Latescibacterota bacterium]
MGLETRPQMIIAHRGGVVDAERSENSFKALREAILRGYTHVEIDARITADGHVICFHNDDLMEEADIEGKISEMPRDEVTEIVLTRSGEKIPTFEDYCAHCAGHIDVMIDLKGCKDRYIDQYADEIETALTKHCLIQNALILINKVPKNNQDKIAERFLGKIKCSWRQYLKKTQEAARQDSDFAGKYYVFNHGLDFSAQEVKGFRELGLDVIVSINTGHYTLGDPQERGDEHIQQMLEFGVNGFQIDSCYDHAFFDK